MGVEIKSNYVHNSYKVNNTIVNSNINNNINSTYTDEIEEISLDTPGDRHDDIQGEIVYSHDNVVITKNKEGEYNISVTTSDNKRVNYELYDQGRGIGISNQTHLKPGVVDLKEKMPASEYEKIKKKIISDCQESNLSPERLQLLEYLLSDDIFLTALNDFSIGNGCGTYSLLEVLNGYYNLNINEVEFFTSFLIKNLHNKDENIDDGFDAWLEIVFGKINSQSNKIGPDKVDDFYNNLQQFIGSDYNISNLRDAKTGGPLTVSAMSKILDNLGYKNELILGYNNSDFDTNGEFYSKLQEQLKSGKPVILTVSNDGKTIAEFPGDFIPDDGYSDYVKSIENDKGEIKYKSLTNSFHFLTIVSMDDNGDVYIADSRYLPDNKEGNQKYSHILKINYNDFVNFISDSNFEGENSNTFTSRKESSGMIFIDN